MLHQLDNTDISILKILQENARLTNQEIADKLHKTASPIYRRIKRLEEEGFIKKYVAVLDPKKIDRGLMAFTHVQLKDHSQDSLRNFEQAIIQLPEVLECYHMTGAFDFILRIVISDMDAYHHFLRSKLAQLSNIGTVQSFFVMSEIKTESAYPL